MFKFGSFSCLFDFVILCTFLLTVLSRQTENDLSTIIKCEYGEPFPEAFRVQELGSQEKHNWVVKRNQSYSLDVEFKAQSDAQKVRLQLFLLIGKKSIKLPFFNRKDFCNTSNLQCPLYKQERYTFRLTVHIPEYTPNVKADLKMQLMNEKKHKLLCFILPLIVEN